MPRLLPLPLAAALGAVFASAPAPAAPPPARIRADRMAGVSIRATTATI